MKNNNKFAIYIVGFDGYSFLWKPFFDLLRKNWPKCNHKIYLSTNILEPNIDGVTVIPTKKNAEWSTRVRMALECIPEENVYMLLEDFFIGDPIDEKEIKNIEDEFIKYSLNYIKLPYTERWMKFKKKNRPYFLDSHMLYRLNKKERYAISLVPGIWNKKFLLKLVGDEDYNPWKFEADRLREAEKADDGFFSYCAVSYQNPLHIYNGVIQGKYVPNTYKHIKKLGVELDFSKMELMNYKKRLRQFVIELGSSVIPDKWVPLAKKIARIGGVSFITDKNE